MHPCRVAALDKGLPLPAGSALPGRIWGALNATISPPSGVLKYGRAGWPSFGPGFLPSNNRPVLVWHCREGRSFARDKYAVSGVWDCAKIGHVRLRERWCEQSLSLTGIEYTAPGTPRVYNRWEKGGNVPHFDTIVKLADILQVSLDELAGRKELSPEL